MRHISRIYLTAKVYTKAANGMKRIKEKISFMLVASKSNAIAVTNTTIHSIHLIRQSFFWNQSNGGGNFIIQSPISRSSIIIRGYQSTTAVQYDLWHLGHVDLPFPQSLHANAPQCGHIFVPGHPTSLSPFPHISHLLFAMILPPPLICHDP